MSQNNGRRQCTATAKQTGKRCRNRPSPGMNVCRFHGGRARVGTASPNFIHGRYSKHLPRNLAGRLEDALSDPDSESLQREIALIDVRIGQLLERLDGNGAGPAAWKDLGRLWKKFNKATMDQDAEKAAELYAEIGSIIGGAVEDQVWEEVMKLTERRRRMVESDVRLTDRMITIEAAVAHLALLSAKVREIAYRIADEETARRIVIETSDAYKRSVGTPLPDGRG